MVSMSFDWSGQVVLVVGAAGIVVPVDGGQHAGSRPSQTDRPGESMVDTGATGGESGGAGA